MIDDRAMRELARDQHGSVSVEQAIALGFSAHQRSALVDGRRWELVGTRAYRLVGVPPTDRSRLSEEVLCAGPGAAVNAMTSLAFWGVRGTTLDPIQVTRPRDRADRRRTAIAHEPVLLPAHHVVRLDGIPVVVPARALFEVAGSERRGAEKRWWVERVDRLVNNALTDQLVSGSMLHVMLGELAQRGRPGIRVMRQVLEKIGPDYVAPASGLESRVVHLCGRFGFPPMRRQVDLGDDHRWIGRVDFVAPDLPFVLEVQSTRFHTSGIDRQLDRERFARLDAAGFEVGTVTDDDVWYRPDAVDAVVRVGRDRARRRTVRSRAA